MQKRANSTSHAGFTLIELLVVIAIIAILAAILFPVFAQAREKARAIDCVSNERQIGIALVQYEQDYDEGLPAWDEHYAAVDINECLNESLPIPPEQPEAYWPAKLQPYVKSGDPDGPLNAVNNNGMWHCLDLGDQGEIQYMYQEDSSLPKNTQDYSFSYGYNGELSYTSYPYIAGIPGFKNPCKNTTYTGYYRYPLEYAMDEPASTVFVGDGGGYNGRMAPPFEQNCWYKRVLSNGHGSTYRNECWEEPDRHNGGANYVFCDGHVQYIQYPYIYPKAANPAHLTPSDMQAGCLATAKYMAYNQTDRALYNTGACTYQN